MKLSACAATVKLAANERKMIAVRALAGAEPVSTLAARHGVSRPLVYRQMPKASAALDELFSTEQTDDQDKVLFSLPVTKRWLEQATLGLTMIAHASMRGVVEFMHDVLGVSISLGTVHNIHQRVAQRAAGINDSVDLSPIRVGLHDELFQGSQPVLTGIDAASTYCYLLAAEDHRDGDTWAIHLLDLKAQGLEARLHDCRRRHGSARRPETRMARYPVSWRRVPHPSAVRNPRQSLGTHRQRCTLGTRSPRSPPRQPPSTLSGQPAHRPACRTVLPRSTLASARRGPSHACPLAGARRPGTGGGVSLQPATPL